MDKFLLAENPLRSGQSGLWIIHLLDPVAIIECIEGHIGVGEVTAGNVYEHFIYNGQEWTLRVHHFFTTDFIEEPEKRALKLLKRAWRWYFEYMEWEDNNIDEEEK